MESTGFAGRLDVGSGDQGTLPPSSAVSRLAGPQARWAPGLPLPPGPLLTSLFFGGSRKQLPLP